MNLTEFLLARISEDEATAAGWPECGPWGAHPEGGMWMDATGRPIHGPGERVLAECEAKRRVVEACTVPGAPIRVMVRQGVYESKPYRYPADDYPCEEVLRLLALPYSDHADYDEAWRA